MPVAAPAARPGDALVRYATASAPVFSTPAEAASPCDAMDDTHAGYGYELVQVPRLPVARRADFVLPPSGG